jgi:Arc/MetJ family transcription regulator
MQVRTNIVLDDETVEKAFRYSGAKSKKELIHEALREFIISRQRLDLRDLRGKIEFKAGYDYKKLRKGD